MTNKPSDAELSRLLSGRDGPSVLDKEAAFEGVMHQVAPPRRRPRWAFFAVPLAAAAALLLAVLARPDPAPEFGMKGPGGANLELSCVRGAAPAPCAPGATLLFDVTPSPSRPFFAAFGQRADGTGVWLLPAAGGASTRLEGLSARGFELEAGGPTEVYGLFTAAPMTREALEAALGDRLESNEAVTVVRRAVQGVK